MGYTEIQRGYIMLYGSKSSHGTNDFFLIMALTQVLVYVAGCGGEVWGMPPGSLMGLLLAGERICALLILPIVGAAVDFTDKRFAILRVALCLLTLATAAALTVSTSTYAFVIFLALASQIAFDITDVVALAYLPEIAKDEAQISSIQALSATGTAVASVFNVLLVGVSGIFLTPKAPDYAALGQARPAASLDMCLCARPEGWDASNPLTTICVVDAPTCAMAPVFANYSDIDGLPFPLGGTDGGAACRGNKTVTDLALAAATGGTGRAGARPYCLGDLPTSCEVDAALIGARISGCFTLCLFVVGLWYGLLRKGSRLPDRGVLHQRPEGAGTGCCALARLALRQNCATTRKLRRDYSVCAWFLASFSFYAAGASSTVALGATFLTDAINASPGQMNVVMLATLFSAAVGAHGGAVVARRVGSRRCVQATLVVWLVTNGLVPVVLHEGAPTWLIALFGIGWGIGIGATWSQSYAVYAQIIPGGQEAEFMGYIVFVGRLLAWAPAAIYAAANTYANPHTAAALCVPPFFVVGLVLFTWKVDMEKGRAQVGGTLDRRTYNTEGRRTSMFAGISRRITSGRITSGIMKLKRKVSSAASIQSSSGGPSSSFASSSGEEGGGSTAKVAPESKDAAGGV